jgi:hypothetical protein
MPQAVMRRQGRRGGRPEGGRGNVLLAIPKVYALSSLAGCWARARPFSSRQFHLRHHAAARRPPCYM